ncbi:MAG TPA: hypothetical protein G4O17_02005 [Dehalococcoidia bacterium]|nr:hypothetical protein [Dehalococcoidia bacterium]
MSEAKGQRRAKAWQYYTKRNVIASRTPSGARRRRGNLGGEAFLAMTKRGVMCVTDHMEETET